MEGCLICAIARQLVAYLRPENHGKPLIQSEIYFRLKEIGREFEFGQQEDVHEFFTKLVDKVEKAYNDESNNDTENNNKSPTSAIFELYCDELNKCEKCNTEVILRKNQPFLVLDLSISDEQIKSVDDALKSNFD